MSIDHRPRRLWVFMIALVAMPALAFFVGRASADHHEAASNRLFELRVYTTNDGKLDDLHARFRDHTNRIFQKHGMDLVGYWTPIEGDEASNTLIYILAYPDRDARNAAWAAFRDDPDWQAAAQASQVNGRLVSNVDSTLMAPTDYSPIK